MIKLYSIINIFFMVTERTQVFGNVIDQLTVNYIQQ